MSHLLWDVKRANMDPEVADDLDAAFANSPYNWAAVQGYRTTAYQTVLYNQYRANVAAGRPADKAAKPGHSAHEHTLDDGTPASLAADVARVASNGERVWDYTHPAWQWLWAAVKAAPRLHSGVSFDDPDHIESTRWAAMLAQIEAQDSAPQSQT